MKMCRVLKPQSGYRSVFTSFLTVLAVMLAVTLPQLVHADPLTPPAVPTNLQVPVGHKLVLVGHAFGTQQYLCLSPGTSAPWAFFGPQATVFKDNGKQILTHFLSPNPDENGTARATWQDSKDSSTIWAVAIASSTDPAFVAPGAIPWLLLDVVGARDGLTGGDRLTATTFIQRLNTSGGVAPASGCAVASDMGKKALVPYTTDYYFYESTHKE